MSRYIEAKCRLCRRYGQKLMLKGDKCTTVKCTIEKGRDAVPGQISKKAKDKLSEYGKRLQEKQKLKFMAGINEAQLRRYFKIARSMKGIVGENLLRLLEMRLDNIVYRLGWAPSRNYARQLVSHNHIMLNGEVVNIPSLILKVNDKVMLKEEMRQNIVIQKSMQKMANSLPTWLKYDEQNFIGEIISLPQRDQMSFPVNEMLIVEFYSK